MKSIAFIALQAASEAFCVDPLPDDWESLSEEEQVEWLEDNASSSYESEKPADLFDLIDAHSRTILAAIKDSLKLAQEKLIDATVDCSLPSDANEICLASMLEIN